MPSRLPVERFHSRDRSLCKFIGTKESVYIRKEFNSHRIGLEHQHGRRDVMWQRSMYGTKWNETKGLKSDTIIQIIRQNDERPPAFKREWK